MSKTIIVERSAHSNGIAASLISPAISAALEGRLLEVLTPSITPGTPSISDSLFAVRTALDAILDPYFDAIDGLYIARGDMARGIATNDNALLAPAVAEAKRLTPIIEATGPEYQELVKLVSRRFRMRKLPLNQTSNYEFDCDFGATMVALAEGDVPFIHVVDIDPKRAESLKTSADGRMKLHLKHLEEKRNGTVGKGKTKAGEPVVVPHLVGLMDNARALYANDDDNTAERTAAFEALEAAYLPGTDELTFTGLFSEFLAA